METGSGLVFSAAEIRAKGALKAARPLDPASYAGLVDKPSAVKSACVELVFSVDGGSIFLEARASAELDLECARCAGIFPAGFTEPFDEVYEDTVESIDVCKPALEAIAVMVPMKPLCGAGCKGLCPVCGCDLNRRTCGCKMPEAPDETKKTGPFRALKRFKGKKDAK
ncbi:MAG: DUF177 domain-containing protein [Elusimicrobia bacterium]|nr:DUF177 domain-containing protein [Elusimicrobiota bacterium]